MTIEQMPEQQQACPIEKRAALLDGIGREERLLPFAIDDAEAHE